MVGPWPLAPHHDLIMVFTSYTILMQLGSKTGYYIPLPHTLALSSVLFKNEQKWMCHSHGILQLPRIIIKTIVLPLHLHLSNDLVPERGYLLV